MKSIWKFTVDFALVDPAMPVNVEMPDKSKILPHVEIQNNVLVFWAIVKTDAPKIKRQFRIVGTGWELDNSFGEYSFELDRETIYIGTAMTENSYVWHLFEIL